MALTAEQEAVARKMLGECDDWSGLRDLVGQLAEASGNWAGIPLPIDGQDLVVEPRFPNADKLMALGVAREQKEEPSPFDGCKLRNRFWSWSKRCDVLVYQYPDGRIEWGLRPAHNSITLQLGTLGASDVWGLEQETNALHLLGTMLRHRQFKQYLLTGSFMETSERSHVTYIFRKLRPTVAIVAHGKDGMRILASLCMHPIAYYAESWAGAMCPTDDVVAHLALVRGDEALYWKRCTQHPAWRPEAGL